MGVKISELSEANSVQNQDLLAIVQNGETKKVEVETLLQNIQNIINERTTPEDFTTQIQFNETVTNNTRFVKVGNMVFGYYQGSAKTHTAGEQLATIPTGYRPLQEQTFAPFVINDSAYGDLVINDQGKISINHISSTSISGRIYANFSYSLS
jgi:hypothetical protein